MTVTIPWPYVLASIGVTACIATGAVLGVGAVLLQMWGERRGS